MISFTNAHNIQLFQDFINRERNSIILRDKNDSFRVILPEDFMSGIFNSDEYLSINSNKRFSYPELGLLLFTVKISESIHARGCDAGAAGV